MTYTEIQELSVAKQKELKLSVPERIVLALLWNMRDRSGFDHWWDQIDEEVQDEAFENFVETVRMEMEREPEMPKFPEGSLQ